MLTYHKERIPTGSPLTSNGLGIPIRDSSRCLQVHWYRVKLSPICPVQCLRLMLGPLHTLQWQQVRPSPSLIVQYLRILLKPISSSHGRDRIDRSNSYDSNSICRIGSISSSTSNLNSRSSHSSRSNNRSGISNHSSISNRSNSNIRVAHPPR